MYYLIYLRNHFTGVCVSYIVNYYVIQLIIVNSDPIQTTFKCIETRITRFDKMCLHNLSIRITFFSPPMLVVPNVFHEGRTSWGWCLLPI